MWTPLRIVAGVVLLALYAWFLSRPVPVGGPDDPRWRRIARSAAMTLVVAIGLPLAGLTLLFGAALWKVLLAGWVWVLGGGVLGFGAAFIWELGTTHLRPEVREPAGRVIFWTFFVLGGLGLVLLAVRWIGSRPT
jgi:hypothetical protein